MLNSYKNAAKILSYLFLFFTVSLYALRQIVSLDIFFHIKAGEWIWNNLSIPHNQLYSFTLGSKEWLDHEWLFQVIVYPVFKFLSYNGLIFLRYSVLCIILYIIYLQLNYIKRYIGWAIAITLLSFIIACSRFTVRPHMFSLLFVSLFIYSLKNYKGSKSVFLLIIIQVLWSNMHGYFILGPVVVGLFLLSKIISSKAKLPFSWNANGIKVRELKMLFLLFVLLVFSTAINPYFFKSLLYPFSVINHTLSGSNKYAFGLISELESINMFNLFNTGRGVELHMLLVLFFLTCLINLKKLEIFDVLIVVGFFSLSLIAVRHVDFFAISTAILCLANLKTAEETPPLFTKGRLASIFNKWIPFLGNIVVFFMVLFLIRNYSAAINSRFIYDLAGNSKSIFLNRNEANIDYADAAAMFIKEHGIEGNIFNHQNNGHYLIFSLFPQNMVSIDGRTEVYGDKMLRLLSAPLSNPAYIDEMSKQYDFECILWPSYGVDELSKVFKYLLDSKDWKLVFFDFKASVFLKDVSKNRDIIKKYTVNLEHFVPNPDHSLITIAKNSKSYPISFLRMAAFFISIDMPDKALEFIEIAEEISPDVYDVYNLKGVVFTKQGKMKEALAEFLKASDKNSSSPAVFKNIGLLFLMSGQKDIAKKYFEEGLKVNPGSKELKRILALTH